MVLPEGRGKPGCGKPKGAVILRSGGDEEPRIALKKLRARFFAALRMTANRLRMTAL
jgi:hypothetical protein